jgi:hypothetical protein
MEYEANAWYDDAEKDLWNRTLERIPTLIGRLAYLARLRNRETDLYEHYGLMSVFGEEKAESALRSSHQRVLEEWLSQGINFQREDLSEYLDGLPQSKKKSIQNWIQQEPFMEFLPPLATEAQRLAFQANMQLILPSLRNPAAAG